MRSGYRIRYASDTKLNIMAIVGATQELNTSFLMSPQWVVEFPVGEFLEVHTKNTM